MSLKQKYNYYESSNDGNEKEIISDYSSSNPTNIHSRSSFNTSNSNQRKLQEEIQSELDYISNLNSTLSSHKLLYNSSLLQQQQQQQRKKKLLSKSDQKRGMKVKYRSSSSSISSPSKTKHKLIKVCSGILSNINENDVDIDHFVKYLLKL
ncbi:hypothetical protein LY90DRAFT_666379 [Neocallimastix californiae]|uniref:Uncharacterized protein n=1 Tax=Neocallimastix californiae TaxID=1754190 RepID=A0A1Y2ERU5_9FUNG|nr:hypothetical protein LY90DRAFT_666379 [Neocallimastix californiae]|eukprot:ORY74252.1 hypothetical protein LY90DRAFT_666379 [Neocallimastix californiae]